MILVTFFIIYFKQIFTKKNILSLLISSVLILLLTSSFWMPLLEMKINTNYAIFVPYLLTAKGDLRFSTIKLAEVIAVTPIHHGGLMFHLSITTMIMFIISIIFVFRNKLWKEKKWIFLFSFTVLSLVMITPVFPWYYTPSILQTLQFPWRLALYYSFGGILFSGICIKQLENKKQFKMICIIIFIISIFSAYYYTGHLDKEKIDLNNINYSKGLGNEKEYLPETIFKNKEYLENRTNDIVIKSGSAEISILANNVPNLTFDIALTEETIIELPRIYYLGYKLENSLGEKIPLEESENGFLQAKIEESGILSLSYQKTFIMKFSFILSMVTFLCLIIILIRSKDKTNI